MSNIVLKDISLRFGTQTVFDRFSAEIGRGIVTALSAPSGSGKTTLLYLIAGLRKPDEGTLSGIDPAQKISFVFQDDRLFPWLNVLHNAAIASERKLAADMLLALGLNEEDFKKYPSEISGGMRRRVAITRALLASEDIVLLDEPFSGLDEASHRKTADFVFSYLKGKTVIFSTHDTNDITHYAQQTIFLNQDVYAQS